MDTQSMNPRQQGRRIHVLTGSMAGTVQPIPPASSSMYTFDPRYDDILPYLLGDLFDDGGDDYLAAPAHRGSKRPRVAATSEAILSLEEVTGRSRSGEECAVCLQDFGADETLRAMPCSHAFHQHCISEWLLLNAVCPLCRRQLPEEEEEDKKRSRI